MNSTRSHYRISTKKGIDSIVQFWLFDKGRKCLQESSIAKAYSTEAAVRATSKAVRIHGAWGVSEAYPVERYFGDAEFTTVGEATNEAFHEKRPPNI